MKRLGHKDLRKAILQPKFRELFPDLHDELEKARRNPGCKCNAELFDELLSREKEIKKFFGPGITIDNTSTASPQQPEWQDDFRVIDCHVKDLERELSKLPAGRKQISVARYEDRIVAVINIMRLVHPLKS